MSLASAASLISPRRHASRLFSSWLRRPWAIAAVGLGLLTGAVVPVGAADAQANLADGVYAFGESAEAGQLGTTYMVMAVEEGQLVGGFYQPSSSFDCFRGAVTQTELALTVIDSYSQTEHPFALALENRATVAATEAIAPAWVPSGFHPLADLSDTDRHVLQVCRGQG